MITIDETSPIPLFDQIYSQLDGQIRTGILPAGYRLPSVRQLAADLRIAPGTVMRAYAELESRGLIETRHGRAARVAQTQQIPQRVLQAVRSLNDAAQQDHIELPALLGVLKAYWKLENGDER